MVAARCQKLGVECVQGVDDKAKALRGWLDDKGVDLAETAYVGNDVNDLPALDIVGFPFVVNDAHPDLAGRGRRLSRPGGRGAVREVTDLLLGTGYTGSSDKYTFSGDD